MAEPTVLVIPMHSAPSAFAYSNACIQSTGWGEIWAFSSAIWLCPIELEASAVVEHACVPYAHDRHSQLHALVLSQEAQHVPATIMRHRCQYDQDSA